MILAPCAITNSDAVLQRSPVYGISEKDLPAVVVHIPTSNEYIRPVGGCIQPVTHAEIAEGGIPSHSQSALCIRGLVDVPKQEDIEVLGNAKRLRRSGCPAFGPHCRDTAEH
jgi:hypothetical protein